MSSARQRESLLRRCAGATAIALCIAYAVVTVGVWLTLRAAGESWWPATFLLFSPRWVWALPLAGLLPLTLVFRPRWAWLPLATGLVVIFGLMGMCLPWRQVFPAGGSHTVRIVTANLHENQVNIQKLDAFLVETRPDIVAFQDCWASPNSSYVQHGGWQVRREWGLMLASRWPIRRLEAVEIQNLPRTSAESQVQVPVRGAAVLFVVDSPAGPIPFANLHLDSPHRALDVMRDNRQIGAQLLELNSVRREEESMQISRRVHEIGGPFVMAGDFNTPDDSPIFREAWSDFRDAFSVAGFGFGTSYAKHHTWLRIDHILYDLSWSCRSCYTSEDIGSGHRAVFAEIAR